MADDLDPVVQQFTAEVNDYIDEVKRSAEEARRFADDNRDAARALSDMRDHAEEAAQAAGHLRDEAASAAFAERAMGDAARNSGHSFISGFLSFMAPSKFQAIVAGIASALAVLPALTAVIGAAAGVGLAAKFLIGTKKAQGPLYAQFESMMGDLKGVIQNAVTPMIGPLRSAFEEIGSFVKQIGPEIKDAFAAIGPLVQPFVTGMDSLVGGLLPGFISLMRAAQPAVQVFAGLLANLGASLGGMFSAFAPVVRASSVVLRAIGSALSGLLPIIGHLAASLATSLAPVLASFAGAIHALSPAISAIGKILGELAGAVLSSLSGALQAVAQVVQGIAPSFGDLAKVLNQVFNAMENAGVFGVLEDALEQLAAPLAALINALVASLMPVLPQIISGFTDFAAVLSSGLAGFVGAIATGLAAIVRAVPPLVPAILGVVGAVKAWRAAQLLLDLALDANPVGVIILAVAALIGVVVEIIKHWSGFRAFWKGVWHDVQHAAEEAWHFLDNDVFHPIMHAVEDVVTFVRSHWKLLATILATVLLGPVGGLVVFLATHWSTIRHDVAHLVDDVRDWFRRLPGLILTALEHLPGDLEHLGKLIIDGLWAGLKYDANRLLGWVKSLGHDISGWFGDALHMLSPSRVFFMHGVNTLLGYINGLKSVAPMVRAAMQAIGGQIATGGLPGVTAAPAASAVGGPRAVVNIEARFTPGTQGLNDPHFLQYIQQIVQEATLRYQLNNASNGLALSGRL